MYQGLLSRSFAVCSVPSDVRSDDLTVVALTRAFRFLPGHKNSAPDRLVIRGALDIGIQSRLRRVLTDLRLSSNPLVIDLTRVTYADCSSLQMLLDARSLGLRGRSVTFLFDTDGLVWRVIGMLRMNCSFPLAVPTGQLG